MARLTRSIGFGLAFFVAFQAAALGSVVVICRSTAEKMSCDCPRHRERAADYSTLRAESCCHFKSVTAETAPAVVKGEAPSASRQSVEVWSTAEPLQALPREGAISYVAPKRQALASTPLYLSIRNLLI